MIIGSDKRSWAKKLFFLLIHIPEINLPTQFLRTLPHLICIQTFSMIRDTKMENSTNSLQIPRIGDFYFGDSINGDD